VTRDNNSRKRKQRVQCNAENTDPVCKKILLMAVSKKCKMEFLLSIEFE